MFIAYYKMGDDMNLNEEQKKVVYTNERFLFLLASAGSGKTRVIVERMKYLMSQGIKPERILAITFTRKAAFEMKERTKNTDVHIHTFHQYCYSNLIELNNQAIEMTEESSLPFSKTDLLEISIYKNSLFKLSKPRLYESYQNHLKEHKLKDFDDLLIDYYKHIKNKQSSPVFDYIFIDEFQDTNNLQYELLKQLIHSKTNVLAVGDPDQSIYQFRGANSKIIYRFIKDYQAKLFTLSINYRSNQTITTHANRLIKRNNRRYQKDLIPDDLSQSQTFHFKFYSEIEEAIHIIELIKSLKKRVKHDGEIAVLFRNHERSFEIRKVLLENEMLYLNHDPLEHQKSLQLMTIHKAKGLEFDAVIIIGLEQGVLPSLQQNSQMILDEERRLMFVAITRARKYLYFSSVYHGAQNRTYASSQFIRESGVKTIKNKRINDIISLGDFNGYKAKNDRTHRDYKSSKL